MSYAPGAAGESLSPLKEGSSQLRLHTSKQEPTLHLCLMAPDATRLNQPAAAERRKVQNSCCWKWLSDINLWQNDQSALDSLETFPNFASQNHMSNIDLVFAQEPYTPDTSQAQM